MTRYGLLAIVLAVGGFGMLSMAEAATPKVTDRAGFFSKAAIDQATRKYARDI